MNGILSTAIVGLVVLSISVLALKSMIKKKKSGGCCGGCAGCAGTCPERNMEDVK